MNFNFLPRSLFGSSKPKKDFYNSLQEIISSKKKYCNSITSYITNLLNCLNDFLIRIKNIGSNIYDIEFFFEDKNIHNLIGLIQNRIIEQFNQSCKSLTEIKNLFSKYEKDLEDETKIYDEYKKTFEKLETMKESLKKSKEKYNETGKEMEYKVLQFVENNITNLSRINENEFLMEELEQYTYPPNVSLQDYGQKLKNVNNLIEIYNQMQNKFFNYLPEIIAKDDVFYFNLVNNYVNLLENEYKHLAEVINTLKDNKNFEKKENKSELKKLVEKYEKNKKLENKKKLEHYPTEIDFSKCKDKKQFEIYFNSVNIIKKCVNNSIFPDYNYENELKNFKMNDIVKKLFANKSDEISQSLTDNFLDLIEEPSVHHTFFVILSKLRTNSSFGQKKSLISLLGQGFEIVLSKSKKNKLYDNVKNCIILSQTYYYENESKQKIYIFEYIKNNKWLKTAKFWRNFILYNVEIDLGRFDLKKEKDQKKLGDVVFSNLLTFASNMKNFEIDKRIIVKIIDEFIEKYNYISEPNKKIIFQMILQEKEGEIVNEDEIEKIRKEYDISLENENLLKNDNDKQEKQIKEENEEIKEEYKKIDEK